MSHLPHAGPIVSQQKAEHGGYYYYYYYYYYHYYPLQAVAKLSCDYPLVTSQVKSSQVELYLSPKEQLVVQK